ncbi:hypothetical protein RRF57_006776 [Xylaria bambusicola]|uniref:Uncharacterized protein n=1 Tax=Xylaria bambusicola TaxID=326684 RepID=A0AAN7USP6_9PEZI
MHDPRSKGVEIEDVDVDMANFGDIKCHDVKMLGVKIQDTRNDRVDRKIWMDCMQVANVIFNSAVLGGVETTEIRVDETTERKGG